MIRTALAVAASLVLAGCATQYQSEGMTGGHAEMKGPGKLELVAFSANGFTSPEIAEKYAMYRCAEVAQARGKPFFLMYDTLISAAANAPSRRPRVGIVQNKPTASSFILLLDSPRPGVHDTKAVLEDLRSTIETGKTDKS